MVLKKLYWLNLAMNICTKWYLSLLGSTLGKSSTNKSRSSETFRNIAVIKYFTLEIRMKSISRKKKSQATPQDGVYYVSALSGKLRDDLMKSLQRVLKKEVSTCNLKLHRRNIKPCLCAIGYWKKVQEYIRKKARLSFGWYIKKKRKTG